VFALRKVRKERFDCIWTFLPVFSILFPNDLISTENKRAYISLKYLSDFYQLQLNYLRKYLVIRTELKYKYQQHIKR